MTASKESIDAIIKRTNKNYSSIKDAVMGKTPPQIWHIVEDLYYVKYAHSILVHYIDGKPPQTDIDELLKYDKNIVKKLAEYMAEFAQYVRPQEANDVIGAFIASEILDISPEYYEKIRYAS